MACSPTAGEREDLPSVDLVVPGDPDTPTGGYLYDARIFRGLAELGWSVRRHSLAEDFPWPSAASLHGAAATLGAIPEGRVVVVDGLALAGLAPVLRAHAGRLRLVALVHHPVADETGLSDDLRERTRRAEHAAYALVERIIVTSRWTARRLERDGVRTDAIRVVEPGTGRPASGMRAAPREEPPPRLLSVATLTERKGHALLLDALARVKDRQWHLDCVGSLERDPATAAAVTRRIAALGLDGRVTLHGEVPRATLDALYARSSLFVLASHFEGYGMALAEALVHGLPIIATTGGAIPDTVGDAALLVPPGNVDALARALEHALGDAALRTRLAAKARVRAAALPTWTDASARFAAAIEDLAAGGHGRA